MKKSILLNSNNQFVAFINTNFGFAIPEGYTLKEIEESELPENISSSHYFLDNTWVYNPPKTTDLDQIENAWNYVRSERNRLLQNSDWTQMPDVSLSTKELWATYRQALRDITDQTDPFNIVWPQPPN
jgi:hypothetical protein